MTTDYQAALDYIENFIDYSKTHQENLAPENFELERMFALMDKLGNPHQAYPTLHIAGTKGKGSTSALIAAALQAGGYRTGLYTSPHLHEFTERIQINRTPIPPDSLVALVEKIKPIAAELPGITAYEIQTALAFMYFAEQQVDYAVVEVGLGGRLDSTNVITPLVAVITSISLDHTFILGNTLAEIAGEKGGIIKDNIPTVSAPQAGEALKAIETIAAEKHSPLTVVGQQIPFDVLDHNRQTQTVEIDGQSFELGLLGRHQAENAAVAYAALQASRVELPLAAIQTGFRQAQWPGRFEIVGDAPPIIFDGAHNRHSAHLLRQAVIDHFPSRPVTLVFGASGDKDIRGMFAELLPGVERLMAAASGHPRALSPDNLAQFAKPYACPIEEATSLAEGLTRAVELAGEHGLVLVTGSLYAVGEARQFWLAETD